MNKKRIGIVFLTLSIICSMNLNCFLRVRAAGYSPNAAVTCARNNYLNNGYGLCAEFVSRCLIAGGFDCGINRGVGGLRSALISSGSFTEYVLTRSGSMVYSTGSNSGKVSLGDVIIYQEVQSGSFEHAVLVTGINSNGVVLTTSRNASYLDTQWTGSYTNGRYSCQNDTIRILALHYRNLDTISPEITDLRLDNLTSSGYDVSCLATDNIKVTKVQFPTWTEKNGQDDLSWHDAVLVNNRWCYHVNTSDHNGESGTYITHVYAWDESGNTDSDGIGVNVPHPRIVANSVTLNIVTESQATAIITAAVSPYNANIDNVTWNSSNSNVVIVQRDPSNQLRARIIFLDEGSSRITVTINNGECSNSLLVSGSIHKHTLIKTNAKAATEKTTGNTAYWTCSGCGKYYADANGTKEIAKNSWIIPVKKHIHTLIKTSAKAATEKTTGNTAYWTCSGCGKYYADANGTKEIAKNSWVLPKKTLKPKPKNSVIKYNKMKFVVTSDSKKNPTVKFAGVTSKSVTSVTIPNTIKSGGIKYKVIEVASKALKSNTKIKKVNIGDNVKKIGQEAFYGCTKLSVIVMGKNVTTIGAKAFFKCSSLSELNLTAKVTYLGNQFIGKCTKLSWLWIASKKLTNKTVSDGAFKGAGVYYGMYVVVEKNYPLSFFRKKGLSSISYVIRN